jgi:predicted MFS family arabinose efflux permease
LTQVTLLDMPFWVGKFLFEIPTGVVADKYGRKLSLGISAVLSSMVWLVFAVSGSFLMLALAQFAGAFAATFQSGADEALLFETMQKLGREHEYAKISARAGALATAAAMLSGLAVGVVASYNLLLPIYFTSIVSALMLIPILLMKETAAIGEEAGSTQPAYREIVRQGFVALRQHVLLRWAAAYLVILSCISFYAVTFLQPYTIAVGLSVAMLGPVMVAVQLAGIAGALSVAGAQKWLGNRAILFGVPVLLVVCMLLLGLYPVVPILGVMILAGFLFALAQPVLLALIQSRVSNTARATLLSIQSLLATVFLILTEPALGILSDWRGVHFSYLAMAALLIMFCVPLVLMGRRWFSSRGTVIG